MMVRESIYKHYEPSVNLTIEKDEKAYWFVYCLNRLLIRLTNNNFNIPHSSNLQELNLSPVRIQSLGKLHGHPCYCAEVPSDSKTPDGMSFINLRSLYGSLEEDIFLLAGKALQILIWDQTHQYCGRCGAHTEEMQGERAKKCPQCGSISYPRIAPAVITAILKDDKILLAHAKAFTGKMHSIIAGFVEPGETLEECVTREIMEEVGIQVRNIKYFGSQPWPFPHSMMIGFTAEYESGEISVDGVEISEAGWFDVDNLPELPPSMSIARDIINWYIERYS